MPGQTQDVAEELQKLIREMQEKFNEAGMQGLEILMESLKEIKAREGDAADKVLAEMHDLFTSFKEKLEEVEQDPSLLSPSKIAACTSYYEGRVVDKLRDIGMESNELTESLKVLVSQVEDPMKQFGQALQATIEKMEEDIKNLVKLPSELNTVSRSTAAPDDAAQRIVSDLRKSLDTMGSCPVLDGLHGLREPLKQVSAKIKSGCTAIEEFIMNAPDSIRAAFNMPQPLCFLQSMMVPKAPQAMTELLEIVEKMSKLDLQAMHSLMDKINDMIGRLEPDTVSKPVQKFTASAGSHIDKIETLVSGSKREGTTQIKNAGRLTPRSKLSSMRKIFGGA